MTRIAIIGAGPAGLSAAASLAAAGHSVTVIEREPEPGGIPRHCGHSPYGLREYRRLLSGRAYARRLAATARAAGAQIRLSTHVTALHPGGRIDLLAPEGPETLTPDRVLLAMGCRESSRAARMIGGTKPGGVLNTGALQGLVYIDQLTPFRRPVILGTEMVAFSALLTCRHAGIRPVAMVEPGPRPTARFPAALLPKALGVPLLTGTQVTAIEGEERVRAIHLATPQGAQRIEADGLILTGLFRPETQLLRPGPVQIDPGTGGPQIDQYGRCSDPAYFAAGNLLRGVETAGHCWAEGRAVARAILADLDGRLPAPETGCTLTPTAPLRYVLPQRVVTGDLPPAFPRLRLRLAEPARGTALLTAPEAETALGQIDSRPERRLSLPLPTPRGPSAEITLRQP